MSNLVPLLKEYFDLIIKAPPTVSAISPPSPSLYQKKHILKIFSNFSMSNWWGLWEKKNSEESMDSSIPVAQELHTLLAVHTSASIY